MIMHLNCTGGTYECTGTASDTLVVILMSRGLTRDEATSAIIRGFIKIDIEGLPKELTDEINKAIEQCADAL